MPSLFSKLTTPPSTSTRNNPYSNPHHPSHTPLPAKPLTQPQPHPHLLRPASPREPHDFLAEARQLANRDPITGRLLPRPSASGVTSAGDGARSGESSAYLNRAGQTRQVSGNRYDIVSGEERRRREEAERVGRARGGVEFYAPERRLGEFYGGGWRE